ncbi:MAG: AraC family transcriptional regulator [Synechococcales bacterium]|nr:AraC family transcriptional regulator [Synechococcales bacterium]
MLQLLGFAIAMPLTLSEQDWDDQWNNDPTAVEECFQPEPFETEHRWRCQLETGWLQTFSLPSLWLKVEEYQYAEDCVLHHAPHSWGPASSFFISGTLKNCHHGLKDEILEHPGHHYLEGIQDGVESEHYRAGETVCRVRFGLRQEVLHQFEPLSALPCELTSWAEGQSSPEEAALTSRSFYRQGTTTPEMQVILHQILHCPHRGGIKRLYLEGKVLELAAHQFAQLAEAEQGRSPSVFKADEIERLHHAKAILVERVDNPPSLLNLARQVGLNDFKLKQGFRQVFGTTVFGYLRDYRLEQARLLLAEEKLTVQQVARSVGYEHSGYFAKAFKQKFGVNPKAYQSNLAP